MKDYYKILDLQETATAEEIHQRWIELMQKHHPDHSRDGSYDEEMAKKINEAYQVLKHSGSRMEYDLERQHQRNQKTFSASKLILPVSIATIVLIFAVFIFRSPKAPVSPGQPPQWASSGGTLPDQEPAFRQVSPKTSSEVEKGVAIQKEKKGEPSPHKVGQADKTVPSVAIKTADSPAAHVRPVRATKAAASSPSKGASRTRPVERQKPAALAEVPEKVSTAHSVSDSGAPAKSGVPPVEAKLPPPVAAEEEVEKLFDLYVARYNRKDIQGFLSLFSPRAIQNQKDGLEEIRRIYENFFDQSLRLQYSLDDMRVEIYQNAVEVKARYEVNQISRIDGEKKMWKGRIQWMLVKEDGTLKIISLNYRHDRAP